MHGIFGIEEHQCENGQCEYGLDLTMHEVALLEDALRTTLQMALYETAGPFETARPFEPCGVCTSCGVGYPEYCTEEFVLDEDDFYAQLIQESFDCDNFAQDG